MTALRATHMAREIAEMPEALARLATRDARKTSQAIADGLRALDPKALVTVARGSSDHAALYLSYAAQVTLGLPVASIGPSITSVYGKDLRMEGLAALAISQSGQSRDLVGLAQSIRAQGGRVVTITNAPTSPLAQAGDRVSDIAAGPEQAVAATQSFLNSVVAGLWLIADWAKDAALGEALMRLPDAMRARTDTGVETAHQRLLEADQAVILARGAGLGLGNEIALKLIETCGIHASAFSGAEVMHGPRALLTRHCPVIALTEGASHGLAQALGELPNQDAPIVMLRAQATLDHPLVDPLLDVQPLYRMIERMSRARGLNPDSPRHLRKETKTV